MPFANITISTRECERVRNNVIKIAATKISAGVSVGIGEHVEENDNVGDAQFEISDGRNVEEVYQAIRNDSLFTICSKYMPIENIISTAILCFSKLPQRMH